MAHMIIPHDHHLSDSISYPVDNCPASERNDKHGPGIPAHCYSLNDLTSERSIRNIIPAQLNYRDIIPGSASGYSSLLSESYYTLLPEAQNQLPDLIPLPSSPLRAPPTTG
jgi:hypothetical protein